MDTFSQYNQPQIPTQGGGYAESQVPVTADEMYAHQLQEEKIKNVLSQLNPDNQLQEIEMRIRGYKKNSYTGEWEKIDPDLPEPPKILVTRFISYLGAIMNQNTTQGNVSEDQINAIMGLAISYVTDELDANAEIYNLQDSYTERTRIGHIILNSTFFVLSRALNGQEATRMWGAMSLMENMGGQQQQKNKFVEALKFWK